MSDNNLLRVRVTGSEKAITAFLAANRPGCEHVRRDGEQLFIEVFIRADQLDPWRRNRDLAVKVLFGVETRMKRLVKDVGKGDRFASGESPRLPTRGSPR